MRPSWCDPDRAEMAEQRLAETREQVTRAEGEDLEQTRAALAQRWTGRPVYPGSSSSPLPSALPI